MFGDIIGIFAFIAGGIFILIGIKARNEFDNLKFYVDVDTIKSMPQEIPVIVKGIVSCINPLTSPLTQKPCVYYSYQLQRLETQTINNDETKSVWKTINEDQERIPFYIKDQTGQILIKPDGATIRDLNFTEKILEPGTIASNGINFHQILSGIINTPSQTNNPQEKASETALFTDTELNIFGILSMEGNEMFFQNTHHYPLIITTKSRDQLIQGEGKASLMFFAISGALFLVGIYLIFSSLQVYLWRPS